MAVNILKSNLAKPFQLRLEIEQFIGRVFIRPADGREKLIVNSRRGRSDVFEVAEDASGRDDFEYLLVQCAFSLMNQMMNREARNDGVEPSHLWESLVEIVTDDCNAAVATVRLLQSVQHRGREIERHELRARPDCLRQFDHSASAGAEIKNARDPSRQALEQASLALDAMRNRIRAAEIIERVRFGGPKIDTAAVLASVLLLPMQLEPEQTYKSNL